MFTVAMISQKGGTGKSTILAGLAVEAVRRTYEVAVIDIDPQQSSAKWGDRRQQDMPAVFSAQASRLKQTLDMVRGHGADFVFVDTAGRLDNSGLETLRLADLVLIPTEAEMVAVETLPQVRDMVRLAGNTPAYVLLNRIHIFATQKSMAVTHAMLMEYAGFECTPQWICDTPAYKNAHNEGSGPQELDPTSRASIDIGKLFDFINEKAEASKRGPAKRVGT